MIVGNMDSLIAYLPFRDAQQLFRRLFPRLRDCRGDLIA
jgi:hypothetical protein